MLDRCRRGPRWPLHLGSRNSSRRATAEEKACETSFILTRTEEHSQKWLCRCYAAFWLYGAPPARCSPAAILCFTVCGVGRAGIKRIRSTRLSHSRPSATANDAKIALATPTKSMVYSMVLSSVVAGLH